MSHAESNGLNNEVIKAMNVVALAGARNLPDDELKKQVSLATAKLQECNPFTGQVVHWNSTTFAAVVVKMEESYTLFIGFGLEVIQALQKHEKHYGISES
jgi:hypothetical protein